MAHPDRDFTEESILATRPFLGTFLDRRLRATNLQAWRQRIAITGLRIEAELLKRRDLQEFHEMDRINLALGEALDIFPDQLTKDDNINTGQTLLKIGYELSDKQTYDAMMPIVLTELRDIGLVRPRDKAKDEKLLLFCIPILRTGAVLSREVPRATP